MKVDTKHDRAEAPEECDSCGSDEAELERFYHYGPGHNVDWLCCYCSRVHWREHSVLRGVAAMLNHFEARMKSGRV